MSAVGLIPVSLGKPKLGTAFKSPTICDDPHIPRLLTGLCSGFRGVQGVEGTGVMEFLNGY